MLCSAALGKKPFALEAQPSNRKQFANDGFFG
jgi:hypothetical protein